MNDDELRELIAMAALDALDHDELASLEAALSERPELRAEYDEAAHGAAQLAELVSEEPPAGLRERVMRQYADEGPGAAAGATTPTAAATNGVDGPASPDATDEPFGAEATTSGPPASGDDSKVVPFGRRRRVVTAALAAVAAAAIIVVALVATRDQDDSVIVADVVAASDAQEILLHGEVSGLRLVHSHELSALAVVGENVEAPSADHVYELWSVAAGAEPVRVVEFHPDDAGAVAAVLDGFVPGDQATYMVTVEPDGGSDQPTSDVVAESA